MQKETDQTHPFCHHQSNLHSFSHGNTLAALSVTVCTLVLVSEGGRLRPLPVYSADGPHSSPTVGIQWVLEWPPSPLSTVSVIRRHWWQGLRDSTASLWWQQTSVCGAVPMSDSALKGRRSMSFGLWESSTDLVSKPIRVGVSTNKLCWLRDLRPIVRSSWAKGFTLKVI